MGVGDDEVGPAAEPQELDPKAQREVVEVLVECESVQQLMLERDVDMLYD